MRVSYFRKSNLSKNEIINNLEKYVRDNNLEIWGIKETDDLTLIAIYDQNLINVYKNINPEILPLVPINIFIVQDNGVNKVGILNPEILESISESSHISNIEEKFKRLIDQISNVEERKIKTIKLYATTNCPYCKAEKEYLEEKGIKFEYTLVDINPISAQEMVEKTGQFGVPVTEIFFDDGDVEYIIGFNKERLDKILGAYKIEIE